MTHPTAPTAGPRPSDAPTWVYFVAYSYTRGSHSIGTGSQFITCYAPVDAAAVAAFPATIAKYATPGTENVVVTFYTLVSGPATAHRYGATFDALAERWAALEDEHDQIHPDRSDCGGVGGCPMMLRAHRLEEEMHTALDQWRVKR